MYKKKKEDLNQTDFSFVGIIKLWISSVIISVKVEDRMANKIAVVVIHLYKILLFLQFVLIVLSLICFWVTTLYSYLIDLKNMLDLWASVYGIGLKNYVSCALDPNLHLMFGDGNLLGKPQATDYIGGGLNSNEPNINFMSGGGNLLGKPFSSVLGSTGHFSGGVLPCRLELLNNRVEEIGLSKEGLSADCLENNRYLNELRRDFTKKAKGLGIPDSEFNSAFFNSLRADDLRDAVRFKMNHFYQISQIAHHNQVLFPTVIGGKLYYVICVFTHTNFNVFDGSDALLIASEDIVAGPTGRSQYMLSGLRIDAAIYHSVLNAPGDATPFRALWDVPMNFDRPDLIDSKGKIPKELISRHSWVAGKRDEIMAKALGLEGLDLSPVFDEHLKHKATLLKYSK